MPVTAAIVQARMGSSRLPGKVLADVCGVPAIVRLMNRLLCARSVDCVMLAIPDSPSNDILASQAKLHGWKLFRGHEADVLDRYCQAGRSLGLTGSDAVVRVTGDDPLVDPALVDALVALYWACRPHVTHVSNNRVPSFPYGVGAEVVSFEALSCASREAVSPMDREHVTPFIRSHPDRFPFVEVRFSVDRSSMHFSVDEARDLEFNRSVFSWLQADNEPPFGWGRVVELIESGSLLTGRGKAT